MSYTASWFDEPEIDDVDPDDYHDQTAAAVRANEWTELEELLAEAQQLSA